MKKIIFSLLLLAGSKIFACQCVLPIPQFDFWCSYIDEYPITQIFMIKGVKIGSIDLGTKVLVQDVLFGTPPADTLMFWKFDALINTSAGNSGIYCLYFIENSTQSDTLVLTARYISVGIDGSGLVSGAIIDNCVKSHLPVQNDTVYGQIKEGVSSMPYPEFVQMMEECLPTVGLEQPPYTPEVIEAVSCYPNPIQSNTTTQVQFSLREAAPVDIAIFDIGGRQVGNVVQNRFYAKGTHLLPIDMQTLPLASGVYFCRISTPQGQGVCKMVVMR